MYNIRGKKPSHGHDLIDFFQECEKEGFKLEDTHLAAIVHLSHFYYRDLSAGTKFKTRYPAEVIEGLGGAVPDISVIISLIENLHIQANQRLNI